MAQVLVKGTAWEKSLEDYAHAAGLDRPGWAWEFLRRNTDYCRDYRMNRAGVPVAIRHESGAIIFRPRRRFLAAENWGLEIFADPSKSAFDTHVFWMSDLIQCSVSCISKPLNDNQSERLSLSHFAGKRSVLVAKDHEYIMFVGPQMSVQLQASGKSFLIDESLLQFQHEGLRTASSHQDAIKILSQFVCENYQYRTHCDGGVSKYRDYLVALDGRLAQRSYRDIAEVIYGRERVGAYWTGDTRGLKSKIRRAVECGLALMNGGYRDLL